MIIATTLDMHFSVSPAQFSTLIPPCTFFSCRHLAHRYSLLHVLRGVGLWEIITERGGLEVAMKW